METLLLKDGCAGAAYIQYTSGTTSFFHQYSYEEKKMKRLADDSRTEQ